MKTTLLALIFSAVSFAQTTTISPSLTVKNAHVPSVWAFMLTQASGLQSTSPGAILLGATTITVADATGCNPTLLTPDAPVGTFCSVLIVDGVSGNEAAIVTAVAGNVLTVTRGSLGTTAVAHPAGVVVQYLKYKDATHLFKVNDARFMESILDQFPPPIIAAAKASIATQTSIINAERITAQ